MIRRKYVPLRIVQSGMMIDQAIIDRAGLSLIHIFYAAYDGQVVAATYSNTMGNYVMLDHGGGLYTIYMHASALYVSKDDIVVRGETIAAVGSTGRSTGNHLHFSVRKDGAYTSPWNLSLIHI